MFANCVLNLINPMIIFCSPNWIDTVIQCVHNNIMVVSNKTYEAALLEQHMQHESVKLCLSTVSLGVTMMRFLYSLGVTKILTSQDSRRLDSVWYKSDITVVHAMYGGVTNHSQKFYVYTTNELHLQDVSAFKFQRDASTILLDTIWCNRKRRAPKTVTVSPLQCVNEGTSAVPIFHIGGLLPINMLKKCSVITPSPYLPKGTWGVRKLTKSEIFDSLDVDRHANMPRTIEQELMSEQTIPALCWKIGICALAPSVPNGLLNDGHDSSHTDLSTTARRVKPKVDSFGINSASLFASLSSHQADQKATKADDAEVNIALWRQYLFHGGDLFRTIWAQLIFIN